MPADDSLDAVVVGAGHNGLVAASYLAKAGLRVNVFERREVLGGAAVTEEIAPGFRVSSASYSLSLLRPDIAADLGLRLDLIPKDPQLFVPLPDGRHFFVWRDPARTREELARVSAHDADAYATWSDFWEHAVPPLRALVEDPDPPPLHEVESALPPDVWKLAVAGSAAETVEAFFDAPEVQGCFASQGIIGTWAGVREPGTAWVMAYHALGGELVGRTGTWASIRGGMGAVTQALASAARGLGAEIGCGVEVTEILDHAVRLADGRVVNARAVLSSADPRTTFLTLVPEVDSDLRERVERWRTPGCVVKVNLALDALPDFGPQANLNGTVEIAPSLDYLQAAYEDARDGRPSTHPYMEVFVQSAVDDSVAPPGKHVLSAFTQYVPPAGDHAKEMEDNVLRELASYAPNVPGAVLASDVLGPRQLESRFFLAGGNIFHGEILPGQCFGNRFGYRTPVPGLYLCGSGARPGGGVMGAAGRNAARVVLEDLGRT